MLHQNYENPTHLRRHQIEEIYTLNCFHRGLHAIVKMMWHTFSPLWAHYKHQVPCIVISYSFQKTKQSDALYLSRVTAFYF